MSRCGPSGLRAPLLVRVYALLLWLYPAAFRRAYGEEMLRVLRERVRDTRGPSEMLWLWGWALVDLVLSALAERLRGGIVMNADAWTRVGGAAAILGGLATALEVLSQSVSYWSPYASGSSWDMVAATIFLIPAPLLLAIALVLVARQMRGRGSWLVGPGLAVALVGALVSNARWFLMMCYGLQALRGNTGPMWGPSVSQEHAVIALGSVVFAASLAVLGFAVLWARPLPFGNGLLALEAALTLAAVSGLGVLLWPSELLSGRLISLLVPALLPTVLAGIGWIALGVSLWQSAAQPAQVGAVVGK